MAHTRSWDSTDPADTDARGAGAQELRELKVDIKERMSVDHAFSESIDYDGEHKIITLRQQATPGTPPANKGYLYTEEKGGVAQLHFKDEFGGSIQISGLSRVCAKLSADQSLPTTNYEKVLFDAEDFDTNNDFANYRFVAPAAGYYWVTANIQAYRSSGSFNMSIAILKNGEIYEETVGYSIGHITLPMSCLMILAATNYIEIYAKSPDYTGTVLKHENRGTIISVYRIR